MPAAIRKLTLYSRDYCHLCHEMARDLAPLAAERGFAVEVVEVDDVADLEEAYGELVPVLVGPDGREICHYHLDRQALEAYLAAIG